MYRRLTRDIDVSELRHLRSEGLSNKTIAERLDISTATVSRYLGPMTSEERSVVMRNSARGCVARERIATPGATPLILPVQSIQFRVKGASSNSLVDMETGAR